MIIPPIHAFLFPFCLLYYNKEVDIVQLFAMYDQVMMIAIMDLEPSHIKLGSLT